MFHLSFRDENSFSLSVACFVVNLNSWSNLHVGRCSVQYSKLVSNAYLIFVLQTVAHLCLVSLRSNTIYWSNAERTGCVNIAHLPCSCTGLFFISTYFLQCADILRQNVVTTNLVWSSLNLQINCTRNWHKIFHSLLYEGWYLKFSKLWLNDFW